MSKTKKETSFVKVGKAVLPCDATANGDRTFDDRLVATLEEKVFYLNFDAVIGDFGTAQIFVNPKKIKECKVIRITASASCGTMLKARGEDGSIFSGVQELFFRTREDAEDIANRVNAYSFLHCEWKGDWYDIYKSLFRAKYPYMLKFPVKPGEAWMMEAENVIEF